MTIELLIEAEILRKRLTALEEKEKKYAWHDLRKDPEDLPKDGEYVLLYLGLDIYIFVKYQKEHNGLFYEPIAWKLVERFEDEIEYEID